MKITILKDKDKAAAIRQSIKDNGGYCPCVIEKTPDTKCMCKNFVDQNTEGWCHCGLYYKSFND